jgi:hypothetical protein
MVRQESTGWELCPPGESRRRAARLHGRRQRRRFLWSAGVVAAAATGGVLFLCLRSEDNPYEPSYGGITCSNVKASADAYGKGKLSAKVRDQIRQHLSPCPPCQWFYHGLGLAAHAPHADHPSI